MSSAFRLLVRGLIVEIRVCLYTTWQCIIWKQINWRRSNFSKKSWHRRLFYFWMFWLYLLSLPFTLQMIRAWNIHWSSQTNRRWNYKFEITKAAYVWKWRKYQYQWKNLQICGLQIFNFFNTVFPWYCALQIPWYSELLWHYFQRMPRTNH